MQETSSSQIWKYSTAFPTKIMQSFSSSESKNISAKFKYIHMFRDRIEWERKLLKELLKELQKRKNK